MTEVSTNKKKMGETPLLTTKFSENQKKIIRTSLLICRAVSQKVCPYLSIM